MTEAHRDPATVGKHEAGHATILRRQGRGPIYVTANPHQLDWSDSPEFEFKAVAKTNVGGSGLDTVDVLIAGYLAEGYTIEEMLDTSPRDPDGLRRPRQTHEITKALDAAAGQLGTTETTMP